MEILYDEAFASRQIGNLVIATVESDMRKNSAENYTLSDYIEDFEGTEAELNIALIKWAASTL